MKADKSACDGRKRTKIASYVRKTVRAELIIWPYTYILFWKLLCTYIHPGGNFPGQDIPKLRQSAKDYPIVGYIAFGYEFTQLFTVY